MEEGGEMEKEGSMEEGSGTSEVLGESKCDGVMWGKENKKKAKSVTGFKSTCRGSKRGAQSGVRERKDFSDLFFFTESGCCRPRLPH